MKQFNLEEYLKNPKRKVVTRDGRTVKIHCTNFFLGQPVVAEIECEGKSYTYSKDGRYFNSGRPSDNDLFFAPEKKEGWINIWDGDDGTRCVGAEIFESFEDAKNRDIIDRIATVKIEWEE